MRANYLVYYREWVYAVVVVALLLAVIGPVTGRWPLVFLVVPAAIVFFVFRRWTRDEAPPE